MLQYLCLVFLVISDLDVFQPTISSRHWSHHSQPFCPRPMTAGLWTHHNMEMSTPCLSCLSPVRCQLSSSELSLVSCLCPLQSLDMSPVYDVSLATCLNMSMSLLSLSLSVSVIQFIIITLESEKNC